MKKNLPLLLGSVICSLLLIVIVGHRFLVTRDPYETNVLYEEQRGEEVIVHTPPYPPGGIYWLGTDILGRDLYSRIITGAGMTLGIALMTTCFKYLVGVPLGFFAGFKHRLSHGLIKLTNGVFNGIPALIFAIVILKLPFIKDLTVGSSILAFAIVIALGDWSRVAKVIEERTKDILQMNFIQGEIAIGKSKLQIALRNVLPHLSPSLVIHFFLEMGQSILFIAKLGVFGAFVGASMIYSGLMSFAQMKGLSFDPEYYPEWGGMLFSSRYALTSGRPWVVLFTVTAVFISILGFNLLGEGLKRKFEQS